MSVLEQVTTQEVVLTEEEAVTQPSRVWSKGQTLDPGNNKCPKPKKRKQKRFMQGSKSKHQRHFSGSIGKAGKKVGEQCVVGSPNTKTDGQAVSSPLTKPDSSNELGANGNEKSMNNRKQDEEIKDTKEQRK